MRIFYYVFVVTLLVGSVGCAEESDSSGTTDTVETAAADTEQSPTEQGLAIYQEYCTGCHGDTGIGDGPIVEDLKFPPSNLRLLSQRNNGVFPAEDVYAFVDGSDIYADHGATREMPIWGNIWIEEDGQPRPEAVVRQELSAVVEYIRTLQD